MPLRDCRGPRRAADCDGSRVRATTRWRNRHRVRHAPRARAARRRTAPRRARDRAEPALRRRRSRGRHGHRSHHPSPARRCGRPECSSRLAGDVAQNAGCDHREDERRATERDEGERDPGYRQQPDDTTDVDRGLRDHPDRDARGKQHPEAIGCAQRGADAQDRERDEQAEDDGRPDEPELFADHREDEVGVSVREEQPLRPASAEAHAVDAATPERDQRLHDLVAGVGRVGARMQEREHARAPVRGRDCKERGEPDARRADHRKVTQPHAPGDEHRGRDHTEQDCRVEIRLERHEGAVARGDHEHRPQHAAPVPQLALPSGEQVGREQDDRELGELGRLEPPDADPEPAPRSGHMTPDPGYEHEDEEPARDHEERAHPAAPAPVVDAQGDREPQHAQERPDQLALEEVPRRAVAREREHRRSGQDHHDTDDIQDADRREQQDKVGGRRAARRQPRALQCRRDGHGPTSTRSRTSLAKSAPRAAYESYQSKEAHAGESNTVSPRRAYAAAVRTASRIEVATVSGTVPAKACAISVAASPIATIARNRGASTRSAERSRPLFRPPAISTTSSRPRTAASVAWTLVAFESSTYRTPSCSVTRLIRCGNGGTVASALAIALVVAPTARATAAAASALATSCDARRGNALSDTSSEPSSATSSSPVAAWTTRYPLAAPGATEKATRRAGAAASSPATTGSSALKTRGSSSRCRANTFAFACA